MRKQFASCLTEEEAYETCPWATCTTEVEGGWMCFESYDDFILWKNQV